MVQELDEHQCRVQLTNLSAPTEPKLTEESGKTDGASTMEDGFNFLLSEKLCSENDVEKIRQLVTPCSAGTDAVDADQQHERRPESCCDNVVVLAVSHRYALPHHLCSFLTSAAPYSLLICPKQC